MRPALPGDCAVNTAVVRPSESSQQEETLSSLPSLNERPIAIDWWTLDSGSIPQGAAPAKLRLGPLATCLWFSAPLC